MKKTFYFILVAAIFLFTSGNAFAQFLDPSFGSGGSAGPFNNSFQPAGVGQKIQSAQSMTLDNNGRILIVGHMSNGSNEDVAVMRLNPNGTLDGSFGQGGVTKFSDLGGLGSSDEYGTVIGFNSFDNTIILAGYRYVTSNNVTQADVFVMQLFADGSLNNNFGAQGVRIIDDAVREEVYAIAFGNAGGANGIYIGGLTAPDFANFNLERGHVWRLNNMGGSVTGAEIAFSDARCRITSLFVDPNGGILAGGENEGGPSRFAIARFNQNFSYDNSFDNDGKTFINVGNSPTGVSHLTMQADQKIIASGAFFDGNTQTTGTVVTRLNIDGTPDNTFSGGFVTLPFNYTGSIASPRGTVLQADGKIIVSGLLNDATASSSNFGLARLNTNGSQDNTFGTNGYYSFDFGNGSFDVNSNLLLQADGKVVAGTMSRLNTNGPYLPALIRLQFTQPLACSISGLDQACTGMSPVHYFGPQGMETYSWSVTGNASIIGPANVQNVDISVGNSINNSFTLSLTVTQNSSSTTCTKIVTVTHETCQITGPSTTCGGTTVFTGPPGYTFYSWSIAQGSGVISGSSSGQSVSVFSGGGSYTLALAAKGGCNYDCAKVITVNPVPTCNITGAASIPAFTSGNVYSGPSNLTTYRWSLTGTGAAIVGATNAQTVNVTANGSGNFTLFLVTSLNGCTSTTNCQFPVTVDPAVSACTYTQDIFSKKNNKGCLNGTLAGVAQLMQNAFGGTSNSKVFGSTATFKFFSLFRGDILNGNIYKMLPGFDGAVALGSSGSSSGPGANYDDKTTWPLVPIPTTGMQKGQISNTLLSQLIVLWFNLANNNALGNIPLTNNILTTRAATACGNNTPTGTSQNFVIPQNVITALNASTFTKDINGLFQLANNVLGSNGGAVTAADARDAIEIVNNAFAGCRILTGTSSGPAPLLARVKPAAITDQFITAQTSIAVKTYPNPYHKLFTLQVNTPESGMAHVVFYAADGTRIFETRKFVSANIDNVFTGTVIPYKGTLFYKVFVGKYSAQGVVTSIN